MKTLVLAPIKMYNERVPRKSTKVLCDGTPLIQIILYMFKDISHNHL